MTHHIPARAHASSIVRNGLHMDALPSRINCRRLFDKIADCIPRWLLYPCLCFISFQPLILRTFWLCCFTLFAGYIQIADAVYTRRFIFLFISAIFTDHRFTYIFKDPTDSTVCHCPTPFLICIPDLSLASTVCMTWYSVLLVAGL